MEQEKASKEEEYKDTYIIKGNVEASQPTLRRFTWDINPPKKYENYVSPIALISNFILH